MLGTMQNKVLDFLQYLTSLSNPDTKNPANQRDHNNLQKFLLLELRIFRRSWKRYHITDICHTCHKLNHPLESEAEAGMRDRAKPAGIKVPPQLFYRYIHLPHSFLQFSEPFLPLRTPNNFTYTRRKYIH